MFFLPFIYLQCKLGIVKFIEAEQVPELEAVLHQNPPKSLSVKCFVLCFLEMRNEEEPLLGTPDDFLC